MENNYATVIPIIDGLNIDQLQDFLKCIEYSHTVMNLHGGDIDEMKGLVLIFDLTIYCKKSEKQFFTEVFNFLHLIKKKIGFFRYVT
jgi:hypothetical protein